MKAFPNRENEKALKQEAQEEPIRYLTYETVDEFVGRYTVAIANRKKMRARKAKASDLDSLRPFRSEFLIHEP